MTGEEISGPPGQKLARLLAFVGAGAIFSLAANKWRAWEAKSMEEKNQTLSTNSQSIAAQEALK
ncbi:hypothetical protein V2J09_007323 [Rumex salicifolius]